MGSPSVRILALALVLSLAGTACSSAKNPQSEGGGTATGEPAAKQPPATTNGGGDWCLLVIKIATESGAMVDKHFRPPTDFTSEQLQHEVRLALAHRAELLTGIPADVRGAMAVELDYFQVLADSNFTSTEFPAGLTEAIGVVNAYEVSACGIVFD